MARKSIASLAIVTPGLARPDPPAELLPDERDVWVTTVGAKPSDWFTKDMHPLLVAYCRSVVVERQVAGQVAAFDPEWLTDPEGLKRYDRLGKMLERQARLMANLATRMRLTQQSKYGARAAETKSRPDAAAKPWEAQKRA